MRDDRDSIRQHAHSHGRLGEKCSYRGKRLLDGGPGQRDQSCRVVYCLCAVEGKQLVGCGGECPGSQPPFQSQSRQPRENRVWSDPCTKTRGADARECYPTATRANPNRVLDPNPAPSRHSKVETEPTKSGILQCCNSQILRSLILTSALRGKVITQLSIIACCVLRRHDNESQPE